VKVFDTGFIFRPKYRMRDLKVIARIFNHVYKEYIWVMI
jgi:hypothetical protein